MKLSAQPPPGYKHGQTRAPLIWEIAVPLNVVAIIMVCLRFYVRARLVKVVGKDDWLLLTAVLFLCGYVGSTLWGVTRGLGRHQYEVFQDFDPRKLLPLSIMGAIFYYGSLCCIQCSILCFYLRLKLQLTAGERTRRLIYAVMCFSILNNIVATSIQIVFTYEETFLVQSHKYFGVQFLTCSSLNLATDILIWCIPLPSVYPVIRNLSTRKRVLLVLVFAIGALSWCSSILRIAWRKYITNLGSDPTYNAPILIVLYTTEISLAITCVSLVTLRPLIVQITKGFNWLRTKRSACSTQSRPRFGATPQSRGFEFGSNGSKTTDTTGGSGTYTAVGEEMMVLKDHGLIIQNSQLAQHICGCPCEDGDVESGSLVAPASRCPRCLGPAPDTQLQVPVLAATGYPTTRNTTYSTTKSHSSRETLEMTNIGGTSQGIYRPPLDAPHSSESMVNLTKVNTNPSTHDPML